MWFVDSLLAILRQERVFSRHYGVRLAELPDHITHWPETLAQLDRGESPSAFSLTYHNMAQGGGITLELAGLRDLSHLETVTMAVQPILRKHIRQTIDMDELERMLDQEAGE